jgi:hypothetical protein
MMKLAALACIQYVFKTQEKVSDSNTPTRFDSNNVTDYELVHRAMQSQSKATTLNRDRSKQNQNRKHKQQQQQQQYNTRPSPDQLGSSKWTSEQTSATIIKTTISQRINAGLSSISIIC